MEDMIFSVLAVTLVRKDDKLLKIISQWHPLMHDLNQNFSMQKYLNRCDLHIMKALRKFFFFEKRAFYWLSQQLMPKRATKFMKQASCEIWYLELINRMMEQGKLGTVNLWNGRISWNAEYLFVWNISLKISGCNKMRKLFMINRQK